MTIDHDRINPCKEDQAQQFYSYPDVCNFQFELGTQLLVLISCLKALGCRKNLETYTKYTHHILIFFILYVDKTLWNVPLAFLSNTFEQKFWIKRFTVTTFIIKTPLPSWHPNDTLKYVNAFEVSCSRLEYIYKCKVFQVYFAINFYSSLFCE